MPAILLLDSPVMGPAAQMAWDDALLGWAPPDTIVLRFYRWEGQAATFGYFQRHADMRRAVADAGLAGVPLVRRPTGGGLVLHNGDLTFSIVFHWAKLITASWIYKDLHRAIHLGLKAQSIASRLWSPAASSVAAGDSARGERLGAQSPSSCFPQPSPMDLVHEDGTKFLGGALRRRLGVGLYQGSLRPEGFSARLDRLRDAIVEGAALNWRAVVEKRAADQTLAAAAARLERERYLSKEWNNRR